jgi:Flp pilus assembly protein TadG
MSMSNASETNLLELLFNNVDWPNVGDAAGLQNSATAGSFYVALHTADPGDAGNQSTNEVSYTGYARVAVARSVAGFTVSGNTVTNAATVQFGECTAGTATATHFSVGLESAGATDILYSGALDASRSISAGITPLFNPGDLEGTVD